MPDHNQGGKPTHQRRKILTTVNAHPWSSRTTPSTTPVSEIIRRNWHVISEHPSNKDIFTDPTIISYRRNKNIKDHLVRASLESDDPNTTVGTSRCQRRRCNTCKYVLATSTITGPKGDYHIKKAFTYTTSHVVYTIGLQKTPTCHVHRGDSIVWPTVSPNIGATSLFVTWANQCHNISRLATTP